MILLFSIFLAVFVVPPGWAIPIVLLGALCELGEAFFLRWYSRRHKARVGAETMIGRHARVETACLPDGQIRLGSELWAAHCAAGAREGDTVVVRSRDDLTLVVEREG
jgi:membrane protein implicated in regulation of membrane protease activity